MITIEINDRAERVTAITDRIEQAVNIVLAEAGIASAEISIAVVDDAAIWQLNREYLKHDYPTDVLSFVLSNDGRGLCGEIVVSADTAAREAVEHHWSADEELLLYVVHGALHLVGHEDNTQNERREMRSRERQVLAQLRITATDHVEPMSAANGGTKT